MLSRGSLRFLALAGLNALVLIFALMSVSAARNREISTGWRVHTLDVLLDAERFRNLSSIAQETGSVADIANAFALLARMQRETADNARQQRNIAVLSASLRNRSSGHVIEAQLDRVAAEEHRLLALRTAAADAADRRIRSNMWIVSGLGVAILSLSVLLAFASLRTHRRAADEAAERGRIQEELNSTGAMLRTIMETTIGLIYAKDIEGRMILANPPAMALLGKSWAEIQGRTDADLLNDSVEGHAIMITDRRIMNTGIAETIEESVSRPDGSPAKWLSIKAPLRDADGTVFGMVGMSVDITERKQTEAKLQILQAELIRMARLGAMGELSLALAHELNQPLAAIVNHLSIADYLISSPSIDRPVLAKRLTDASDQVMRAGAIVKRLRAFVEHGEADKQVGRVGDIVAEAVALISGSIARRGIKLGLVQESGDALVFADRVQIQQVLISLVNNASAALEAHAPPSPSITVIVRSSGDDMVDIDITDNGPGITAEMHEDLFQRFSTSTPHGGLGIPISMRVAESHGGTLGYESREDGGARLTISLPTVRPPANDG